MSCGVCSHGIQDYGYQVKCQCIESDYFDELMDCDDSCNCFRQKKVKKVKEEKPVEKIEHIELDLSVYDKPEEPAKTEKKEKNYKVKAGTKTNTIYVIVCDGHIANFGDKEYGGKHSYFHEEEKAISYCKRKSTLHIKYKYIECKINNEL